MYLSQQKQTMFSHPEQNGTVTITCLPVFFVLPLASQMVHYTHLSLKQISTNFTCILKLVIL